MPGVPRFVDRRGSVEPNLGPIDTSPARSQCFVGEREAREAKLIRHRFTLASVALLAAFMVAACGSSAATWPASGPSGAPGTAGTLAPGQSAAPTVNPDDPGTVVDHVIGGAFGLAGGDRTITSFHLKVALGGTIKASYLQSAAGSTGASITKDVVLDGTSLEGDVDVVNQAAHFALSVPGLELLGGTPITGDLIVVDQALYAKVSILGDKYTKMDASSLGTITGSLPVAVPTPGASALTSVEDQVAQLRQQLKDAGATTTLVGVEQIGGKDAYHIAIGVPIAMLNKEIAAASSPEPAQLKLDSASVNIWAYKDSYNLAQLEVKGASSAIGSLDLVVTVTNYDAPVTISAPPASEVESAAP